MFFDSDEEDGDGLTYVGTVSRDHLGRLQGSRGAAGMDALMADIQYGDAGTTGRVYRTRHGELVVHMDKPAGVSHIPLKAGINLAAHARDMQQDRPRDVNRQHQVPQHRTQDELFEDFAADAEQSFFGAGTADDMEQWLEDRQGTVTSRNTGAMLAAREAAKDAFRPRREAPEMPAPQAVMSSRRTARASDIDVAQAFGKAEAARFERHAIPELQANSMSYLGDAKLFAERPPVHFTQQDTAMVTENPGARLYLRNTDAQLRGKPAEALSNDASTLDELEAYGGARAALLRHQENVSTRRAHMDVWEGLSELDEMEQAAPLVHGVRRPLPPQGVLESEAVPYLEQDARVGTRVGGAAQRDAVFRAQEAQSRDASTLDELMQEQGWERRVGVPRPAPRAIVHAPSAGMSLDQLEQPADTTWAHMRAAEATTGLPHQQMLEGTPASRLEALETSARPAFGIAHPVARPEAQATYSAAHSTDLMVAARAAGRAFSGVPRQEQVVGRAQPVQEAAPVAVMGIARPVQQPVSGFTREAAMLEQSRTESAAIGVRATGFKTAGTGVPAVHLPGKHTQLSEAPARTSSAFSSAALRQPAAAPAVMAGRAIPDMPEYAPGSRGGTFSRGVRTGAQPQQFAMPSAQAADAEQPRTAHLPGRGTYNNAVASAARAVHFAPAVSTLDATEAAPRPVTVRSTGFAQPKQVAFASRDMLGEVVSRPTIAGIGAQTRTASDQLGVGWQDRAFTPFPDEEL